MGHSQIIKTSKQQGGNRTPRGAKMGRGGRGTTNVCALSYEGLSSRQYSKLGMLGERQAKGSGLFEVCKLVLVSYLYVFEYGGDAGDGGEGLVLEWTSCLGRGCILRHSSVLISRC